MDTHYRHTQIGWVILGVVAAIVVLVLPGLPGGATGAGGGLLLAILASVALLFSTLRVEVDRESIRLRFGVGLIRKRIELTEVRDCRAARNPWYCGWGIRLRPGGVVWNVSGYDAVELGLANGRRFWIGTDEPAALVAAIERVRPAWKAGEASADEAPLSTRRGLAGWWPWLLVGLALLVAIIGIFRLQMRPPAVTVGTEGFEVETLFYGATIAADDITSVSLEPSLPRVLARTNGFSAAGVLRGHFTVARLGRGRLYVDVGTAPYVLVRLRKGFVILNMPEPELTRELYDEMARAWPDRVSGVR